ncbi:MAG: N-acetylglucosamine kinase [Chthonomonadales bacterium]
MKGVLAIDAGGSKCDALLVTPAGEVIGWGRWSVRDAGSGRGTGGSGRSGATVRRAVQQALRQAKGLSDLHVVGYGASPKDLAEFAGRAGGVQSVRECDAAMALAGIEAGVVALAGTGAFVYGRRPDGKEVHLDALGPLLGDYGSGYHIGLMAIRAAAKASWHPRHATSLEVPVLEACQAFSGQSEGFHLVAYMLGNPDRAEVASLAELVNAHAEAGDRHARSILETAADELAETLRDVVDLLNIASELLPLVGTGGVITGSHLYWEHFCLRCREFAPGLEPRLAPGPLVAGVALLGLKHLGKVDDLIRRRLLGALAGR